MCKYSEKQLCSTETCSQALSYDSLRGDTKLSGFGQKVLNESTKWVRGSLRTCQIRGLQLVFCIRLDMKENTIIENRARDPVTHCCPNCFQLSSSRVLTAPSSLTLFAGVVSLHLLSDHRYIY